MELNAHLSEFGALAEYLAPEKREVYRRINFEYLLLINNRKPSEMQSILWDGIQSNLINRRNSFEGSQNGHKMNPESLQTSIALTQFLPKFNSHSVVESIAPVQSLQNLETLSRDVSLALSGSAVSGELTDQAMADLYEALNGDRSHSKWLLIAAYKQVHKAIRLHPQNYRAQFAYAWLNAFFFRKPEKAEKHLEAVISNAFESDLGFTVFALRHLAEVRRDLGKFSAAVEAANEAYMLDQQRTLQIQFELARYLTLDGQHGKALNYLEDLLVDHPEFYWQALAEPDFAENVEIVVLLNALSRAYLELDENFDDAEYENSIDEAELAEVLDENARINKELAEALRLMELKDDDTDSKSQVEHVTSEGASQNIAEDSKCEAADSIVRDAAVTEGERPIVVRSAPKKDAKARNGKSHQQPEPQHADASAMKSDTPGDVMSHGTEEFSDVPVPDEDILFEDNTEQINQLLQRIRNSIYRSEPGIADDYTLPETPVAEPDEAPEAASNSPEISDTITADNPDVQPEIEQEASITALENQLDDIDEAGLSPNDAQSPVTGRAKESVTDSVFEDSPEEVLSESELLQKVRTADTGDTEETSFNAEAQAIPSPESPLAGLLQRIGDNIRETDANEDSDELLPVDDVELPEHALFENIQEEPDAPVADAPEDEDAGGNAPEIVAKIDALTNDDFEEVSAELTFSDADIEAEGAALIAQIEQYAKESLAEQEAPPADEPETETQTENDTEPPASAPADVTISSLLQLVEQNAAHDTEVDMFKNPEHTGEAPVNDTMTPFGGISTDTDTVEILPAGVTEAADEIRHEMELAIQRCEMLDSLFTRKDKQRTQSQIRDIADDAVEMLPKLGDMERQKEVKMTKKRLQQQVDFFINRHRIVSRIKGKA